MQPGLGIPRHGLDAPAGEVRRFRGLSISGEQIGGGHQSVEPVFRHQGHAVQQGEGGGTIVALKLGFGKSQEVGGVQTPVAEFAIVEEFENCAGSVFVVLAPQGKGGVAQGGAGATVSSASELLVIP